MRSSPSSRCRKPAGRGRPWARRPNSPTPNSGRQLRVTPDPDLRTARGCDRRCGLGRSTACRRPGYSGSDGGPSSLIAHNAPRLRPGGVSVLARADSGQPITPRPGVERLPSDTGTRTGDGTARWGFARRRLPVGRSVRGGAPARSGSLSRVGRPVCSDWPRPGSAFGRPSGDLMLQRKTLVARQVRTSSSVRATSLDK